MACKKCNEDRRKRINESKKFRLVDDYFMRWRWWLLVVFISACSLIVYIFNQSDIFWQLGSITRIAIATCWAFTVIVLAIMSFPKCGGGLLSMSAMLFIVGSLTGFEEPIMSLAVCFVTVSVLYLLIQVLVGIRFKFDIRVKELPWFIDNSDAGKLKRKQDAKRGVKE